MMEVERLIIELSLQQIADISLRPSGTEAEITASTSGEAVLAAPPPMALTGEAF